MHAYYCTIFFLARRKRAKGEDFLNSCLKSSNPMKIVLALLLSSSLSAVWLAPKEFVCLPCGQECDSKVYDKSGQCASCGMNLVDKSTITFKNISVDELCRRMTSNPDVVILDVRSPGEFNGTSTDVKSFGHFKNAINVNVSELENRIKEIEKYKGKEVLVYCSHAHRSAVASYFLSTHGFGNVRNMLGGVSTINPKANDCLKKSYVAHGL
jgi:rhodanese-related sulfurtransferase